MLRTRRIIAGVSDSPGNLPALRHAADLARVYDAALTFVHAWPRSVGTPLITSVTPCTTAPAHRAAVPRRCDSVVVLTTAM